MTSINYDEIYSYFLGNITDYSLASLEITDAEELMNEYLHKSISEPYIRRLYSSISLNDELKILSFEINNAINDDFDYDFTINVLSKEMVCEWLKPYVRKTTLINQHITSSRESKFFSQSQHLSELRSLLEDTEIEVRKLIRDRGYLYNSYLGGNK